MKNTDKKETNPLKIIRSHPLYKEIKDEVDGLMKLAVEINAARNFQGLSQEELAKTADTTQKEISKVESGDINIRFNTLRKIAKSLGIKFLIGDAVIVEESTAPAVFRIINDNLSNDLTVDHIDGAIATERTNILKI
jgi:transcriptional regulator with XRE-family HTH domain